MGSSRCRAAAVWPARYGDEQGTVRHSLSTSGFTKTAAQRTREHWSIYGPPRMPKTETLPIVKLLHQCLPSKTLTSLSKHFLEQLRQRLWLRGPQQKSLLLVWNRFTSALTAEQLFKVSFIFEPWCTGLHARLYAPQIPVSALHLDHVHSASSRNTTLKSTSVSVCFRGISRLPSAFVFLRWFKLAHISIQVCTFHDRCKQGVDQQSFNRKSISRKIMHPQSWQLQAKLTGERLK